MCSVDRSSWKWHRTNCLCWLPVIIIVSMMTSSHHNSSCWSKTCADCQSSLLFSWWLPVITIVPMMTSSHYYCSHNDFESSQLSLSTLKQHLCWLSVIIIVSMMTSSHHYWRIAPIMTSSHHSSDSVHVEATSVLTVSHHYRFHDDFQPSPLFPWWLPVITIGVLLPSWLRVITALTLSTLKQHLCWLPVIIIVSMMTSSHHNKRNRENFMWGTNQRAVAGGN